jgi:hypothetical protein
MNRLLDGFGWAYAQLNDQQARELRNRILCDLIPHYETPAERRAAELGAVAAFLRDAEPELGLGYPIPLRIDYDRSRPAAAPSSRTLVRRYGSWHAVCAAAFRVAPDGTYDRTNRGWLGNQPWPPWNLDIHGRPRYTRDEVIDAVRQCGAALGRVPNHTTYRYWAAVKRRDARGRGIDLRLPCWTVFRRLFPEGGFYAARSMAFPDNEREENQ